jgi:Ni/Co efflux regulator RcnB
LPRLVPVHGRVRLASSGEMQAVAPEPESSFDVIKVLASLTPPLIHNVNGGPLSHHQQQQQQQQQQRHRHLVESDWKQIGSDVEGNGDQDYFGFSLAMSADGNRFVVSATDAAGSVRVFQRVNDSWQQVGNTISGELAGNAYECSGGPVAMSADGSRIVAVALNGDCDFHTGSVSVFQFVNDSWQKVGNTITGDKPHDRFGASVAMSADGSRIAIGAPQDTQIDPSKGLVRVFDEPTIGSDWTQIGDDIVGIENVDGFGFSVAMAADGSRIIAGAPFFAADSRGQVRVFEEPKTGSDWIQVGPDIDGENSREFFGKNVAITAEGSRIAVNGGDVRIFQLVNDSWPKVGNDINGASDSVAMSADGSRIAIGDRSFRGGEFGNLGRVRVFGQPSTSAPDWNQIGSDILADDLGFAVAMSADGATVVAGAIGAIDQCTGYYSPFVRVYEESFVECPLVHCDFATLQVAQFLSNESQKQRILEACGIISVTAKKNGRSRNVNVFDSSNIRSTSWKDDPDLGSPNRDCPSNGPGIGVGGGPNTTYPNCVVQGNLLIIQDTSTPESRPNDSGNGGCMYIRFADGVSLVDMGFLDMEEPGLNITVRVVFLLAHFFLPHRDAAH